MRLLLATEFCHSFYAKYIRLFSDAALRQGHSVGLLRADAQEAFPAPDVTTYYEPIYAELTRNLDAHRYFTAFAVAAHLNIDHVHFIRVLDPGSLWLTTQAFPTHVPCSGALFGARELCARPLTAYGTNKLVAPEARCSLLLHSVWPDAARAACKELPNASLLHYVFDPVYDDPAWFALSQQEARAALGLPQEPQIVLRFGAYFASKGADLAFAAMEAVGDHVLLVSVGDTATAPKGVDLSADFGPRVHIVREPVTNQDAARYFRAADAVLLPYRRVYEHDSSGILVQAMLAGRPVIVPDFSPFASILQTHDVGTPFEPESVPSLGAAINATLRGAWPRAPFRRYVADITSWDSLLGQALGVSP